MRELEELRKEIDELDKKLLDILNKRAQIVLQIRDWKIKNNYPTFDPSREKELLDRLVKENKGPLDKDAVIGIFKTIMSYLRSLEKEIEVLYLGPEGSFTHQAAVKFFGEGSKFKPLLLVEDIFKSLEEGAEYAVVPIENSLEGTVGSTMDLLAITTKKVIGEVYLDVKHSLISSEDSIDKIRKVYSHPQALAQCKKWLRQNLPNVEEIPTSSTSFAAKLVKEERGSAAIASNFAANIFGLNILAENIQDFWNNKTRFLVLGREIPKPTGKDKTSIIFSVKHQAGALYRALRPLHDFGLNMTLIQSRPVPAKPFEYRFFVDFQGHIEDEKVSCALEKIKEECIDFKVLGSYPEANDF
ncbi:prephenate dehydratase [Dictyoglomus thermophilum]|uniref:Bifunctional chorismate mutase/prephenate dehydratase n=1 Tax=Dictyoglomus thermophilum TaxID=14 RepID=A0A7V3ZK45_DICTH|nr:prephenate dehydratase [Dictyoglomus thermophilum]TYT24461.1 prephenate dehydratase [Dictyoglomus thermophilum]